MEKRGDTKASSYKPKTILKLIISFLILGALLAVGLLQGFGLIDLRGIFIPHPHSGVYAFDNPAIIGKPFSYDFSNELIPLLPSDSQGAPYTFYLGPGVGFPPMGLTLNIDGKLHGIPTGKTSTFQVCVKDVSGSSACRTYILDVNSEGTQSSAPSSSQGQCPVTSCDTPSNCCGAQPDGPDGPTLVEIFVPNNCQCPKGTEFDYQITNTQGVILNKCTCV